VLGSAKKRSGEGVGGSAVSEAGIMGLIVMLELRDLGV
jgi:hypothetical protein